MNNSYKKYILRRSDREFIIYFYDSAREIGFEIERHSIETAKKTGYEEYSYDDLRMVGGTRPGWLKISWNKAIKMGYQRIL